MISDGRGALEFLKALLGAYVAERYGLPEAAACAYAGTEAQKTEDSFTTNYDRSAAGKAKKPRVFHLTGLKTDADPLYLEYHLSASAVHAAAKDAGVSVTSYLIAAVICAVRATMTARDRAPGHPPGRPRRPAQPLRLGHPAQLLRARLYHLHPRRCQCAPG